MSRTYVVSDIHGCYDKFKELLGKIEFSDEDELFVLGDVVDRGDEPVAILRDIMVRPNVFFIKGNHELMALTVMRKFGTEITPESIEALCEDDIVAYLNWMNNGGEVTLSQLCALDENEREDMLAYMEEAENYQVLEVGDKLYILVHAGFNNFLPDKDLDDYDIMDLVWERPDYNTRYFENDNVFVISGHTPTPLIRADQAPYVYEGNGHIAIDCGCVFGGYLAAYCLESGEVTYVE